jgi:hypothetical protein
VQLGPLRPVGCSRATSRRQRPRIARRERRRRHQCGAAALARRVAHRGARGAVTRLAESRRAAARRR